LVITKWTFRQCRFVPVVDAIHECAYEFASWKSQQKANKLLVGTNKVKGSR